MLVDVVLLRSAGKKLPRESLPQPVRGELSLLVDWAAPPGRPDLSRRVPLAVLSGKPALWLYDVSVRRIIGDSMLITGGEVGTDSRGAAAWVPQAWWCRLVRIAPAG